MLHVISTYFMCLMSPIVVCTREASPKFRLIYLMIYFTSFFELFPCGQMHKTHAIVDIFIDSGHDTVVKN